MGCGYGSACSLTCDTSLYTSFLLRHSVRAERVRCEGNRCVAIGDRTLHATVDYVFAYTPVFVRYSSPDVVDMEFDPPVDCERRDDFESGVSYLYCAPTLLPTRLEFRNGEAYLVEEGG